VFAPLSVVEYSFGAADIAAAETLTLIDAGYVACAQTGKTPENSTSATIIFMIFNLYLFK